MLCQNCGKNEATTHLKRIINGETAETHLCAHCANALGYGSMFPGFGLGIGDLFTGFFGDIPVSKLSNRIIRCEKCGCSFDDIAKSGKVGCADCYKIFYDKLRPSIQRIHGKAEHQGKLPMGVNDDMKNTRKIQQLREELTTAIEEQNFEKAARLRDEIKEMEG